MPTDACITVGHHPDAPGAVLDLCGRRVSEYELWAPFARELAHSLQGVGIEAVVVERPSPRPDAALAARINATRARCAIELHFNAARTRGAAGTEMLYWHTSPGGRRLAQLLQQHTCRRLGTQDRGLKAIDGGYPFLQGTAMPAVIAEPAFGSNAGDAWRLLTGQARLMTAYRHALTEWLRAQIA